jgi:drug/metabolite transporter (DMT)-like permease
MNSNAALGSAVLGIASAVTWGVGDFCGGLAARRTPVLAVVFLSQLIGLVFLVALALLAREPAPRWEDVVWGAAAGLAGLGGLSALYSALSTGNMGLVAPVTGVISTAMPVVFGALTQGLPQPLQMLGFALAIVSVGLIARTGDGGAHPHGLALAIIAGVSFGAFLILIANTRDGAVFWPLVAARGASVLVMVLFMLMRRSFARPDRSALPLIAASGTMDAAGNFLFVLAEQAGRLDVASALSSLYPASTVLLALVLLHERLMRWQVVGVVLSLIAIPLIVAA